MGMPKKDLTGLRFGRLVAISSRRDKDLRITFWTCRCDCGVVKEFRYGFLSPYHRGEGFQKRQTLMSCGCAHFGEMSRIRRKPSGVAIKTSVWHYYRRNALTRNLEWALSVDLFLDLIAGKCYYCGRTGVTETLVSRTGDTLLHNGVDRINNDIGYTEANSVSCCKNCNIAKNALNIKDFCKWVVLIHNHMKEKGMLDE